MSKSNINTTKGGKKIVLHDLAIEKILSFNNDSATRRYLRTLWYGNAEQNAVIKYIHKKKILDKKKQTL